MSYVNQTSCTSVSDAFHVMGPKSGTKVLTSLYAANFCSQITMFHSVMPMWYFLQNIICEQKVYKLNSKPKNEFQAQNRNKLLLLCRIRATEHLSPPHIGHGAVGYGRKEQTG